MSLKGSKTEQNLKDAFAGESQANRRYLYFANKADVEGQNDVAMLFRSTAEGETGHAHGHLEFLEAVGDPATGLPIGPTRDNLKAAVAGETHEYTDMYPGMAKTAREEGFDEVADWFETLAKAERSHANRYAKALAELVDSLALPGVSGARLAPGRGRGRTPAGCPAGTGRSAAGGPADAAARHAPAARRRPRPDGRRNFAHPQNRAAQEFPQYAFPARRDNPFRFHAARIDLLRKWCPCHSHIILMISVQVIAIVSRMMCRLPITVYLMKVRIQPC